MLALVILGTSCAGQPGAQPTAATAGSAVNPTPTTAPSQSNAAAAPNTPAAGLTVKDSQGQSVTVSGAVPDELKSFPVPDGFTVTANGSGSMSAQQGTVAVAAWTGTGTVQTIGDFYARTLGQQGWSQQFSMNSPSGGSIAYAKGDSLATIAIDTTDSKATKVSVVLAKNLATPVAGAANQNAPTATPASVQVSTGGGVPAALSSLPVPQGFAAVPNGTANLTSGNQVNMATATWTGSSSVADASAFYK
jgi:hypothetical protein